MRLFLLLFFAGHEFTVLSGQVLSITTALVTQGPDAHAFQNAGAKAPTLVKGPEDKEDADSEAV